MSIKTEHVWALCLMSIMRLVSWQQNYFGPMTYSTQCIQSSKNEQDSMLSCPSYVLSNIAPQSFGFPVKLNRVNLLCFLVQNSCRCLGNSQSKIEHRLGIDDLREESKASLTNKKRVGILGDWDTQASLRVQHSLAFQQQTQQSLLYRRASRVRSHCRFV